MPEILLRDYQLSAVEQLRAGVRAGHRSQALCAPTGAGKTIIAAYLMGQSAQKGFRAAFICDRINLVDQTSAVLDSYGISHGIVQAGHWRRRDAELVQVCSAQTLEKRGFFPGLQALYVDECHAQRKAVVDLIRNRPELIVVGLSATPLTKGLAKTYSRVVNVTTTNRLIAENWLVPLKVYVAVSPDMDGAKIVAGEWQTDDVAQRANLIVGDVVKEWIDKTGYHFGGPVKTIVFSANVAHGEELCRQFQAAGHNFVQISYKDVNDEHRRDVIREFRKPDSSITGIVSCEVLTKGFDVPDVLCGIAARPYRKSLSSHIQQLGRVLRPAPGKTFALWLDHTDNTLRFWNEQQLIFERGVTELTDDGRDKPQKEPSEKLKEALKCSCGFTLWIPMPDNCPGCGKSLKRKNLFETIAGEMVELDGSPREQKDRYLHDHASVWRQLCHMARTRKGEDFDAGRRWAQAQYMNLYGVFYRHTRYENTEPELPSRELAGKIKSLHIAYAHRRKAAA